MILIYPIKYMELFHLKANIKKRPTYAIFHHNYKIMAKIQKNQDKKKPLSIKNIYIYLDILEILCIFATEIIFIST
jgi:hypothetical protein